MPRDGQDQSKKTEVIAMLFDDIWPEGSPRPAHPMIVTNDQIVWAITERNRRHPDEKKKLSSANPANFLKDFIRKPTCNENWPKRPNELRITARQRYGNKQVFEFVDFGKDDLKPFEDRYEPVEGMPVLRIETLSIPVEARALGRNDEPWLIQVIVSQRIVHTHFSVVARGAGLNVVSLAHLQMSVKTQPEIDATFIATIQVADERGQTKELRVYITGEAKQFGERLLEDQIREQVAMAFGTTSVLIGNEAVHAVLPIAFKVIDYPKNGNRGIYVAQFNPIMRDKYESDYSRSLHELPLVLQSRAFYELTPPVTGISLKPKRAKQKKVGS